MRRSPRRIPDRGLVVLTVATAAALLAIVIASGTSVVAAALALALLVVPTAMLVLFVNRGSSSRFLDLAVVAAAASLALVVIGGLLLNQLPVGLSQVSWLGFVGVMFILAGIAAGRSSAAGLRRLGLGLPRLRDAATLVAAGGVVIVAILVARAGVQPDPEHFSSVWAMPRTGSSVVVGVENHEGTETAYRVEVVLDGNVDRVEPVSVLPGGQWTTEVQVPAGISSLEVRLYLASQPDTVYRYATVPIRPGTTATP